MSRSLRSLANKFFLFTLYLLSFLLNYLSFSYPPLLLFWAFFLSHGVPSPLSTSPVCESLCPSIMIVDLRALQNFCLLFRTVAFLLEILPPLLDDFPMLTYLTNSTCFLVACLPSLSYVHLAFLKPTLLSLVYSTCCLVTINHRLLKVTTLYLLVVTMLWQTV